MKGEVNEGQICVTSFLNRVLFHILLKDLFSHKIQILQFLSFLDILSPFWSQNSLTPTI